jgi:hypothetical protein
MELDGGREDGGGYRRTSHHQDVLDVGMYRAANLAKDSGRIPSRTHDLLIGYAGPANDKSLDEMRPE